MFFPEPMRSDVLKLYSFIRVVDDYVGAEPARSKDFRSLHSQWCKAKNNAAFVSAPSPKDNLNGRLVKNIVSVVRHYDCDPAWVDVFFAAHEYNLKPKEFITLADTLGYVFGSAEVVGLMVARIINIPAQAAMPARLQGR